MLSYCRRASPNSKFTSTQGQNKALLPLCHQPLTVRDPAMSPRRQSRHLGADKGCQRYRCHSIGSPLSALESCPRSKVPPIFGAPLLDSSSASKATGRGLTKKPGALFRRQERRGSVACPACRGRQSRTSADEARLFNVIHILTLNCGSEAGLPT